VLRILSSTVEDSFNGTIAGDDLTVPSVSRESTSFIVSVSQRNCMKIPLAENGKTQRSFENVINEVIGKALILERPSSFIPARAIDSIVSWSTFCLHIRR
jgi:hypothetical protein